MTVRLFFWLILVGVEFSRHTDRPAACFVQRMIIKRKVLVRLALFARTTGGPGLVRPLVVEGQVRHQLLRESRARRGHAVQDGLNVLRGL